MKAWLRLWVIASVTLLPGSAFGEPSITVTVHDASMVDVKTSGLEVGDFCATTQEEANRCSSARPADATPGPCPANTGASFVYGTATVAGDLGSSDSKPNLAQALLEHGAAFCAIKGTVTRVPVNIAEPRKLTSVTGAWRAFDNPNRFVFLGWDRPAYSALLAKSLERDWTCSFTPTTNPVNGCKLTRSRGARGGVKLIFESDRELPKGSGIVVKLVKANAEKEAPTLVTLSVDSCPYTPEPSAAGVATLYQGAEEQRMEVSSSPACLNQLGLFDSVSLALGSASIQATVHIENSSPKAEERALEPEHADKKKYFLRLGRIPADLALGVQELDVRVGPSSLGAMRIQVRPPGLTVVTDANRNPALSIDYGSDELDPWHSGRTVDGLAVVTPSSADGFLTAVNSATIEVDSSLLALGRSFAQPGGVTAASCQDEWNEGGCWWHLDGEELSAGDEASFCQPAGFSCESGWSAALIDCMGPWFESKVDVCHDKLDEGATLFTDAQDQVLESYRNHTRTWHVTEASWGSDLWFYEDWLRRAEARLVDPSLISFSVYGAEKDPLLANVELRDPSGVVWFRTTLVLAKGARLESLPLPLANALMIECGSKPPKLPPAPNRFGPPTPPRVEPEPLYYTNRPRRVRDRALNGGLTPVFDTDLDSGQCLLHYSPREMETVLFPREAAAREKAAEAKALAAKDKSKDKSKRAKDAKDAAKDAKDAAKDARDAAKDAKDAAKDAKDAAKDARDAAKDARDAAKDAAKGAANAAKGAKEKSTEAATKPKRKKKGKAAAASDAEEELPDDLKRALRLYGEQLVEVVITRGTEPSVTKSWSIDPTKDTWLPLPSIKPRSGDYAVVAHLKGPQPLDVTWRPGVGKTQTAPVSASDLATDFEFRAKLVPRGLGGWLGDEWRTFVTFPVRFTGVRFPAKSSDLSASDQPTAAQLVGVSAGVLVALEPWNYATRTNRAGLPYRFMGGMNLYDLGSGEFAPASLLGMSFTFPVLSVDGSPSARNLSSSIAIGAFWECDLEQAHPFADGNHLLLTFGVDLTSLLSE